MKQEFYASRITINLFGRESLEYNTKDTSNKKTIDKYNQFLHDIVDVNFTLA